MVRKTKLKSRTNSKIMSKNLDKLSVASKILSKTLAKSSRLLKIN
jgi:hypothetical protein